MGHLRNWGSKKDGRCMSITQKIFLITLSSIILIMALIAGVTWINTTSSFSKIEENNVRADLARTENIIHSNIDQLDTLSIDYAHWTDTYNYIDKPDQAYIDSALNESTLQSQKLNVVAILRNSGELLYGQQYDLDLKKFDD